MTRTYAILDVTPACYQEIRNKLEAAGYQHAFHDRHDGEAIDMHGIALHQVTISPADCQELGPHQFGREDEQGVSLCGRCDLREFTRLRQLNQRAKARTGL